ncbi:hypothetical protein LSAT2_032838 [Lamellibrachia satsuma]|nr:hypothetical protein LSAT2_032838 [Lamellibrachia satsuma]
MLDMPIGDVIKLVDASGVDEEVMIKLVEDLREAFQHWNCFSFCLKLKKQIESLMVKIFGSEFSRFDSCTTAAEKKYGPYSVNIFELNPPITIPLGPIILQFRFRIDGVYGARFVCKFCFLTMKASGTITPQIGSSVSGSVGVSLWIFTAELRLTGYLLTTSFPTKIIVEFNKFPLAVRARLDLKMIPLYIELRAILRIEVCICLWKCWCFKKTLINKLIWRSRSSPITKNLFNYNDAEPDTSLPDFGMYSEAGPRPPDKSERKRRAVGSSSGACQVVQLEGRDYTDPAFNIEFGVADDRSEVELTYCVGTFSGGCDVVDNEPLGWCINCHSKDDGTQQTPLLSDDDTQQTPVLSDDGTQQTPVLSDDGTQQTPVLSDDGTQQTPVLFDDGTQQTPVLFQTMVQSRPLYFRVKAQNSMGLSSTTSCQLPTYDMTLPEGRITPDFSSTSHPGLLQGSALVLDDSVVVREMISAGYGKGSHGSQIADWQSVSSIKAVSRVDTGNDPLGLRLLEHFTAPREGRLVSTPVKTTHYLYAQACARECLTLPASVCLSFNYDYSSDGICELMGHVEGHRVYIRENGLFHYFERHGIGQTTSVRLSQLKLQHNTMVYFNYHLRNVLHFENIISSRGVLVDLSPPSPGLILHNSSDVFVLDPCVNYVPKLWQHRCASETTLPTHRSIIDGEGSLTVFNGHEPMTDKKYTRANRVMSANWDGIYDNETGMLMYTWAVGTSPCGGDVVPHNDPHEHLASASEWTNIGVAFPLNLPDNKYYVTVRAINNIEFGPLALSVCHAQPYAVDTTPPIIYAVNHVTYDEDTFLISYRVNATDPVSGIKSAEMGLGRSRRDTYVLGWTAVDNYTHIQHNYHIPDGVAVWVKIRVSNNVDLRAIGHADKPIIVDRSPPIPGLVYDGDKLKKDISFQSSSSQYCANWNGFGDPESGLTKYVITLGTSAGSDDIVPYTRLSHDVTSQCVDGLHLQHKAVYFVSVTAVNGGLVERNVTVNSDGVYVDLTPPVKGVVKDGKDPNEDERYSSEASTVASTWRQFSDPESGLKSYLVNIYRKPAGPNSREVVLHTEKNIAPSVNSLERHHFHLHHGDFVHVDVTATNRAETNSSVTSDGVTVDLTDPKMLQLVDGDNLQHDMEYTDSTTQLTSSWSFVDPESGIDHYKISAYELHQGKMTMIYPTGSRWKIVPASATAWTTDEALNLKIGAHYRMRVTAVNGAGLAAVHYTNGLLVDPTPPKMSFVHAGTLLGESEELIDGYIVHNDENGIQASWGAVDGESDISEYYVGIGTAQGQTDVLAFHSVGLSQDGYIDKVSLALTNAATNSPVYYVVAKAVNGAGRESTLMSSHPIKMVSGDVAGVVSDGPDTQLDIDYQMDKSEVTVTFTGYESERDGVAHYQWAVGSAPRLDDVMPYSYVNLIEEDGGADGMLGVGSNGKGQGQVALSAGVKYYTTVRAVTGAGGVLESASDGFLVDVTAPVPAIKSVGGRAFNLTDVVTTTAVLYQKEVDSFNAAWDVNDPESGITNVWFHLGTYPDAADIHPSTWVGNVTSLENGYVSPNRDGVPNILTLDATNGAGLTATQVSPALVVDTSAPLDGMVNCPEFVQGGDSLECSWSGFIEKESGVEFYKFGIGRVEGDDSMYEFHRIEASINSHKATGLKNGGLKHQETYYVTVTAVNKVGLTTTAFSRPLLVDNTPPQGGLVIELPDTYITSINTAVDTDTNTTEQDAAADFTRKDVICQRALTQVVVAWQPFEDPETEVTRYQVAMGFTPGGTQVHPFEDVSPGALTAVIRHIDLSRQRKVFATVKGYNAAGLHSTATSNGVYMSRISAGLEPLGASYVYDGSDVNTDM